jgi:protein-disulfide isomerase
VRGTPSMFSESGELIGGYLPPATLAKALDESAANAAGEAKPN